MEPARVLVADCNEKNRLALVEHLLQKDFIAEAIAVGDGRAAWELLQQKPFQLVIADMMMPWMDGIILLDSIKERGMDTKVILTSPVPTDGNVLYAIAHGADYFVMKPYAVQNMVCHVEGVLMGDPACLLSPIHYAAICMHASPLDERVADLFMRMGIPAHLVGYTYLRHAIGLCVEDPEYISKLEKKLYPTIAERYNTTSGNVERGMRNALDIAWERGDVTAMNQVFGCEVCTALRKPGNCEFIGLVANYFRQNYKELPPWEDPKKPSSP